MCEIAVHAAYTADPCRLSLLQMQPQFVLRSWPIQIKPVTAVPKLDMNSKSLGPVGLGLDSGRLWWGLSIAYVRTVDADAHYLCLSLPRHMLNNNKHNNDHDDGHDDDSDGDDDDDDDNDVVVIIIVLVDIVVVCGIVGVVVFVYIEHVHGWGCCLVVVASHIEHIRADRSHANHGPPGVQPMYDSQHNSCVQGRLVDMLEPCLPQ